LIAVQPPSGHASFHGRTTVSVTEVSVLQARVYGTGCYRTYDNIVVGAVAKHELRAFPA